VKLMGDHCSGHVEIRGGSVEEAGAMDSRQRGLSFFPDPSIH
jgi:hypothetical protein